MTLQNRVAVVTGGSSGIGRGIATRLAKAGVQIVNADLQKDPKQGERFSLPEVDLPTDKLIREEYNEQAIFVETDVSKEDEVRELIETIDAEFGRCDILINNAGISSAGTHESVSTYRWEKVINVNLSAAFYTVKYAAHHLKESDQGRIVNISSTEAYSPSGGPPYAASKAGIVNLTRKAAKELAQNQVTANVVIPGVIKTPNQDLSDDETLNEELEDTLLPRIGKPEDVANVVKFLVSSEADWITGSEFRVDGGKIS